MSGPSYRSVHYAQRPAKNIERKMMVDVLARLQRVVDLSDSRYIGLGSVFFTDFVLMHRSLGLTNLVSIENTLDKSVKKRFETNRPYDCVDLRFAHTNTELPRLFAGADATKHTIVWLDYDRPLLEEMLTDVSTVTQGVSGFSVLAVSVQVEPGADDSTRVATLKTRVGAGKVPRTVKTGADLAGVKTAEVSREIIRREVQRTLSVRNMGRPAAQHIVAHQVFNFRYADDARMLTVGWVFTSAEDVDKFDALRLSELEYVRSEEKAFDIRVPKLTTRETLEFDRQLPVRPGDFKVPPGVAVADADDYLRLYRFFPTYVDATL